MQSIRVLGMNNMYDNEMQKKQNKKRGSVSQGILYLVLSFWSLTTVYPFVWVILNSFKRKGKILSDSFSLPLGHLFTLDNYKLAWERVDVLTAYKNSLIISTVVMVVVLLLAGLTSYGLARYRFRMREVVRIAVITSMMFPSFATIIPVFRMQYGWGIVNTGHVGLSQLSVIFPQIASNLSFAIVVLTGFIMSLPLELDESAYMEGCNVFQVYFKIIVPIARPSFATVAIFVFLWSYNDLFTQMFFLRDSHSFTITRLLVEVSSRAGTNYGLVAASVVFVVIPVLIVYIFLQKNIVEGMTLGALKG